MPTDFPYNPYLGDDDPSAPINLSRTSYEDLLYTIERRSASAFLASSARIANGLAVNAWAVLMTKKFGKGVVIDGLVKNRVFSFLGDRVGIADPHPDPRYHLDVGSGSFPTWMERVRRKIVARQKQHLGELEDIREEHADEMDKLTRRFGVQVLAGGVFFCAALVDVDKVDFSETGEIPLRKLYGLELRYEGESVEIRPETVERVSLDGTQGQDFEWQGFCIVKFIFRSPAKIGELATEIEMDLAEELQDSLWGRLVDCDLCEFFGTWMVGASDTFRVCSASVRV